MILIKKHLILTGSQNLIPNIQVAFDKVGDFELIKVRTTIIICLCTTVITNYIVDE